MFTNDTNMVDLTLVKKQISPHSYKKNLVVYTFGLGKILRVLDMRLSCTILQITSLFALLCSKNGLAMDRNYGDVYAKNNGGHLLPIRLSQKN